MFMFNKIKITNWITEILLKKWIILMLLVITIICHFYFTTIFIKLSYFIIIILLSIKIDRMYNDKMRSGLVMITISFLK